MYGMTLLLVDADDSVFESQDRAPGRSAAITSEVMGFVRLPGLAFSYARTSPTREPERELGHPRDDEAAVALLAELRGYDGSPVREQPARTIHAAD